MRVTASKVGLLGHCAWSFRPEVEWTTTTSAAADRGSRFHALIATYVATGQYSLPVDEDIAEMFVSAIAWVDHFDRLKLKAEVAFAWDPVSDTAEVIGENIGRAYGPWQAKGLVCMSADLVAVSQATKVGYVADWSTGDASGKGPQLRCIALALARAFQLESVTVEGLEVSASGVRHICTETLDAFALSAVAGEMAEGISAIAASVPTPGEWCGKLYCGARVSCPAADVAIAQLIPATALTRKLSAHIESGDHAAYMLNTIRLVESKCTELKALIKAYVPEGGLVLEDGSVLAEGTRNMERFDKARALGLLREKGATEEEIEACSRSVVESSGLRVSGPSAKPRKRRAA